MTDTYVLTCTTFDTSGVCTDQAWVLQPASWADGLPTVEDANAVGAAFFVVMVGVTAMKYLLKPRKEITE